MEWPFIVKIIKKQGYMKEFVKLEDVLENLPYNEDNPPEFYTPTTIDGVIFVFGECAGVATIGSIMTDLVEDDGSWFVNNDASMSIHWLKDKIKVLSVLEEWAKKNLKL